MVRVRGNRCGVRRTDRGSGGTCTAGCLLAPNHPKAPAPRVITHLLPLLRLLLLGHLLLLLLDSSLGLRHLGRISRAARALYDALLANGMPCLPRRRRLLRGALRSRCARSPASTKTRTPLRAFTTRGPPSVPPRPMRGDERDLLLPWNTRRALCPRPSPRFTSWAPSR